MASVRKNYPPKKKIINACLQNPGKMKCILTFYQMPVEQNTRTDCLDV